jgi:hypothetical protein
MLQVQAAGTYKPMVPIVANHENIFDIGSGVSGENQTTK